MVYDGFTALAKKMSDFTTHASYEKPGEGGLSRMNLYLRDIMTDFETVRAVCVCVCVCVCVRECVCVCV